jgi:hypothetical protein
MSIHCKSGGTQTPPDIVRFIVTVDGTASYVDFKAYEVEECEWIVAGDAWRRIAGFIDRLK